jgi:hypothetical protein
MNKKIFSLLVLFSLPFYLPAVEERNLLPFYYLNAKPLKLKLSIKNHKLCRVKLGDVVQYKNIEIVDCYSLERKIADSIRFAHEKNAKKNELNLMFVDENKKIIHPELQTPNGIFKIKSILYFKKTKTHHIELTDKEGGYYYYTYDPINIGVEE